MKCENCSELLIEYLDNQLSSDDSAAVREHLSDCERCLKEFEDFRAISMAVKRDKKPEVSTQVLARLSKAASDDIEQNKTPFWKNWSYSPILVPALTTAIALCVWFYYGYSELEIRPHAALNQKESPQPVKANDLPESGYGQSAASDHIDMSDKILNEEKTNFTERKLDHESYKESERFTYERLPSSPMKSEMSSGSESNIETKTEPQEASVADLAEGQTSELRARSKDSASKEDSVSLSPRKQKETQNQASKIQSKQYVASPQEKVDEDCEDTIRTNEAIIRSSEPVSKSAQRESYKSLAYCYEQMREYNKAISNYINLEQSAPEESSFANSKILEIKNKMKLEQIQKEQLSAPVPVN